jgi:hypothetical protein
MALLAWNIALDGYKTFAPLKYPPHILALAYLQLSSLLSSRPISIDYLVYAAKQSYVDAVVIDLLDLYIHHQQTTHVGPHCPPPTFMNLQIAIRRRLRDGEEDDGGHLPNSRDPTSGDRGTVRFILDWDRVIRESEILETSS